MKRTKMRLLLCVTAIATMMNVIAPVFSAEAATYMKSEESVKISGDSYVSTSAALAMADGAPGIGVGQWAAYEVNVPESGTYVARVTGKMTMNVYTTVEILKNDETQGMFTLDDLMNRGGYVETISREFNMDAGKHVLKFKPVGGGGLYLKTFEILRAPEVGTAPQSKKKSYRNTYLPTVIQAEDFDETPSGINHGKAYRLFTELDIAADFTGGFFVSLKRGESAEYTFTAEEGGVYDFSIAAKSARRVNIYFDGYEMPLKTELAIGEKLLGTLYIEKGMHTMRIEADDEFADIDFLRFIGSDKPYYTLAQLGEIKEVVLEPTPNAVYKELYVSEDGDDQNDGSKQRPLRTLKGARSAVSRLRDGMSGDIIVNILPGYYGLGETEIFGVNDGGINGYDIIYRGTDKNAPPLISGGVRIEGWEKHDSELWRAPAQGLKEVRNLYVNNLPATRARSKYSYRALANYNDPQTPYEKDGITVNKLNFPKKMTNTEDIELVWPLDWTSQFTPVDSMTERDEDVLIMLEPMCFNTSSNVTVTTPNQGYSFVIENAFELLDEPGEFYFNKKDGFIYYYPYLAEDMATAEIYAAKIEGLIRVEGTDAEHRVEHIIFDNMDFRYGAWDRTSEKGLITVQADNVVDMTNGVRSIITLPAQFWVNYARNVEVRNSRFSCMGSNALSMSYAVADSKAVGNMIKDISGTGITVGHWDHQTKADVVPCENIIVNNNLIWRAAGEWRDCMGITVYYATNVEVTHNDIYFMPYTGISIGWGWGVQNMPWDGRHKVSHNKIVEIMTSLHDGSHIYTLGHLFSTEISHNYMSKARGSIGGVYFDAGSGFMSSHSNVVEESPCWFFRSGLNWIHDSRLYNNYSDTPRIGGPGDVYTVDVEDAILMEKGVLPKEAQAIKDNAGLEPQYAHYSELAELPSWKRDRLATAKKTPFATKKGRNWIEAEDFMEGGEGVGWHKINPIFNGPYRPQDGVSLMAFEEDYLIDTNFDGEWMAYEIEVPETGDYFIDYLYGHAYGDGQVFPATNVYVNDKLTIEKTTLPRTTGWTVLSTFNVGKLRLEAGKHVLKLEILNNGFYFDGFRLHRGEEYVLDELQKNSGDSPAFDECVRVYEDSE